MKMSLNGMMSGLWRWLRLVLGCCLLAACGSQGGTEIAAMKADVEMKKVRMAQARSETSSGEALVVPGPNGKARVLVTSVAVLLQRVPDGPLEELLNEADAGGRWSENRESLQELAKSVRWSPSGKRVCIPLEYKRGSGVAVFTLSTQPAAEVALDLDVLEKMMQERYGGEYRHGRFYYITLSRWIDENHLEINFSGNLVPKVDDDETKWKWYHGSARIELKPQFDRGAIYVGGIRVGFGAETGTVQGKPLWGELTNEMDEPTR
jgi:hypothetical protein